MRLKKKNFRLKIIRDWVYNQSSNKIIKRAGLDYSSSRELTKILATPKAIIKTKQLSQDNTIRMSVLNLGSNAAEVVFILRQKGNGTVCISTQCGCAIRCRFCETGKMYRSKNLKTREIINQIILAGKILKERKFFEWGKIRTVVLMGMGEPLLNYANTIVALKEIVRNNVFGVSKRNIVISTSGIVPMMYKLIQNLFISLAVSLHSTNRIIRNELVPIGVTHQLNSILECCKHYNNSFSDAAVTFEYCIINNVNDFEEDALDLAKMLKGLNYKLNIMPLNTNPSNKVFKSSVHCRMVRFCTILLHNKVKISIRKSRGQDISAACGQLIQDEIL